MAKMPDAHFGREQRWTLDDIPWTRIEPAGVAAEEELLLFVATASFVEMATDLYVSNLLHRFSGEEDVGVWLDKQWQHEEMQHGRALKRYVQLAWPTFDWEKVNCVRRQQS